MTVAIHLTELQRQAIEAQQSRPVEVIDPATNQVYVLVAVEAYERMRALLERPPGAAAAPPAEIPPLMLQSMHAFWREPARTAAQA